MTAADVALEREVAAREGLARLHRFGGSALAVEISRIFTTLAPERLAAARAAILCGDREAVSDAAHALKASCGQIGLAVAERRCRELERAAPDGSEAALLSLLAEIDAECAAHAEWLRRELPMNEPEIR